jgi:predicted amino acid racemase
MLFERMLERNPGLIEAAVRLHQDGRVPTSSWIYDLDAVAHNARILADEARRLGLTTYLMTKQHARNPMVTQVALSQGLDKTVAVDVFCAKLLNRYGIPLGHAGHLNQIPKHEIGRVLDMNPDLLTVYSVEAARQIDQVAREKGRTQDILVRVWKPGDVFFPGQEGGFREEQLIPAARQILQMENVRIVGVTTFPVLYYNFPDANEEVRFNPNMQTIAGAAQRLREELDLDISVINAPGNTSYATLAMLREGGATHVEPGHGLLGTTPSQIVESNHPEVPTYVYVTEVTHHHEGRGYAHAGGLWTLLGKFLDERWTFRALVGTDPQAAKLNPVDYEHMDQIIDYHAALIPGDRCRVGDTVVFPMYTQAHMTRAQIVPVSGISTGEPIVWGVFDHAATMVDDDFSPVPPVEVRARIDELVTHYARVPAAS